MIKYLKFVRRAVHISMVFCVYFTCTAQTNIDSLKALIKNDKPVCSGPCLGDTNKINHLNELGWALVNTNPDTSIFLGKQALLIATGIDKNTKNQLDRKKIKRIRSQILGDLGTYCFYKADYAKALDYYLSSLRISEELNRKGDISKMYSNIGNVYLDQKEYDKSRNYYLRSLKIDRDLNDKNGISLGLSNIGIVHGEQKKYTEALDYFTRSLAMAKEIRNENAVVTQLGNIGVLYRDQGEYTKALDYHLQALKMAEKQGDEYSINFWLGNIGELYLKMKNYAEAEKYLVNALNFQRETGALYYEQLYEGKLSELYSQTDRHQLALDHYKRAMLLKDSLFNDEKNKELTRKEMNYEFEKKEALTKAENDKKSALAKQKLAQKETERNYFIIGFTLVLLMALFILRGYRQKKKANILILQQKQEVEMKNDIIEMKQSEIIDSIRYASRIQKALLPSNKYIQKEIKRLYGKN